MVDFEFFINQAKRLNLTALKTGDCYYIGVPKPETEIMRYGVYDGSVTLWPRVYYSDLHKEIRTEMERIEMNTNEGFEKMCNIIQYRLKEIKMKHRLSKIKEDF